MLLLVFWITNRMDATVTALTPYENFLFGMKANETIRQYPHRLDKFLTSTDLKNQIRPDEPLSDFNLI
jgi:hypothetical protein